MNYGIIGSVGGVNSGTGKDSMTKQFLSQNRRALLGRNTRQHQAYMDKMQNSLNYCIQENMTPYWRNHQSLKGKLHFADKLHFRRRACAYSNSPTLLISCFFQGGAQ